MKKLSLIALLLLAVLLLQECKKDTYVATASSTYPLIATINQATWTTDTTTASIVYSSAISGKVFSFTGTASGQQIMFSVYQHAAGPTTGFPLATYNINDSTSSNKTKIFATYSIGTRNSSGVFTGSAQGTVYPGAGTLTVTAIDSVKKIITGTFSFYTRSTKRNSDGSFNSTTVNQIQSGGFNSLPYTFTSN